MAIWEKLFSPVTDIVKKVLDKVAGDKMSEEVKARIVLESEKMIRESLQDQEESLRDFVLDYEGSAKDMPRVIQILRGSVRPVITYVLVGFWIWGYAYMFLVSGIDHQKSIVLEEMMSLLYKLNLITLAFWFGEKLVTRTGLFQLLGRKDKKVKNDK